MRTIRIIIIARQGFGHMTTEVERTHAVLGTPVKILTKAAIPKISAYCSTGIISQYVGQRLLEPDRRHRILNRGRDILRTNLDYLTKWIAKRSDRFSLTPPRAGGMAFVHYEMPINSSELADRLRREKSVFVVPGDWYGMDQYLRFGIGCEHRVLKEGLDLIDEFLEENG